MIPFDPACEAHMDSREPEELAAALGLEKAHALDPAAFKLAIEKARALSARITQSPSTADEPARRSDRGSSSPWRKKPARTPGTCW